MPSTIPHDPKLVLGSIVGPAVLTQVAAIAKAQAPVEAAENALNSLIIAKCNLDMTKMELAGLNISTDLLDQRA